MSKTAKQENIVEEFDIPGLKSQTEAASRGLSRRDKNKVCGSPHTDTGEACRRATANRRCYAHEGDKKLTLKALRFVENMANPNTKSQKEAAEKAGYKQPRKAASRMMTKVDISKAIKKRRAELKVYFGITPEEVIAHALKQMHGSMEDVIDPTTLKPSITRAIETGAIENVKTLTISQTKWGENIRIEMYARDSARDLLGGYLGLKQQGRANESTIDKVALAFGDWLEDNPDSSLETRQKWMERFARGNNVPVDALASRVDLKIKRVQ